MDRESWLILFGICIYIISCIGQVRRAAKKDEIQSPQLRMESFSGGLAWSGEDGVYYRSNHNLLRFFNVQTREDVVVCTKTACRHAPWDEQTPEAERCPAYLPALQGGMLIGGMLYLFIRDPATQKIIVQRSSPDRSGIRQVVVFRTSASLQAVTDGEGLYWPVNIPVWRRRGGEEERMTDERESGLLRLDLPTGVVTYLLGPRRKLNGNLQILGHGQASLIIAHTYTATVREGQAPEATEQRDYLEVYIENGRVRQILTDLADEVLTGLLLTDDGSWILQTAVPEQPTTCNLYRYDPQDGRRELLAANLTAAYLSDRRAVLERRDGRFYLYDFASGKERAAAPAFRPERVRPRKQIGDYLLGSVKEDGATAASMVLIRTEDLERGELNALPLQN